MVAGHLGDQVQELCDELEHEGVSVRVIHEERQEGTVAALAARCRRTPMPTSSWWSSATS